MLLFCIFKHIVWPIWCQTPQKTASVVHTAPERSQFSGHVPRGVEPLSGAVDGKCREVWVRCGGIKRKCLWFNNVQCNLWRTWFIGMWTAGQIHPRQILVKLRKVSLQLRHRSMKFHNDVWTLSKTGNWTYQTPAGTWLASISSLRVAKWKRLSTKRWNAWCNHHDVHKFHRLKNPKKKIIKMHPFCIHSVSFTLDTQLDVQHGQLVLYVLLWWQ